MTTTAQAPDTVADSIVKQFKDDVGGQLQQFDYTSYNNKVRVGANTPAEDVDFMLRQKYGLIPPQLTNSERNLIHAEEKFGRK